MKEYPYQWRVLLLMSLAWSCGGLAHNCVAFLFPYFSGEFHPATAHNGYLTAILALFWTFSIIVCGKKADEIGHVKVIVPGFLFGAGCLIAASFCKHIVLLYGLTAGIGFGCGAMCSPSLSFLAEQCDPKNRGLFFGVAMSSFTLVGSAMGSVIFTRIGASSIGWRGSYMVIALLVLFAAGMIFFLGRKIPRKRTEDTMEETHSFKELFAYRNVLLATILACLSMMWFFSVATYTILYLVESKSMTVIIAGSIFASFGIGGFLGECLSPIISDYLGRKKVVMFAALFGAIAFFIFLFGTSNAVLMIALAIAAFFLSGITAILTSVIPSESVPVHLVATATSFTPAAGELMGGVVGPIIVGVLTQVFMIEKIMNLLIMLPVLILVGAILLKETAPRVLRK